ncbi:hypothetical protein QTG54_008091 [Skeletonema marinoi]|uniref:F-box domain-containing protein n=1 Tax=Skeletonema marinoi TaxID=267567 RepID=A0AAD8Y896_9STRA|nr:hypothetical protein QTG54_008091 [Skeletonema marinoi]
MASANDSSKRRRLLGGASPDAGCLSELPNGVLTNVANYLDAPSRLFFAAALTNQNAVASDERNTAIVGNEWTTLDFGDIEKDLAVKLSDGDINAVLMCIDAVNRVKKLKLTNCINITGAGLEPLRRSTIIEQIDLSLVGKHQSPRLGTRPPISCKLVLPILDSIIEREGCSLRHLQFPSVHITMAAANVSNKRKRFEGDASLDANCLSDLPSGILTHVANYLAPPSRALFAAALANQNSAASDERNSAIVGNEWTTLDFGDIEKDLAVKLIDAVISAVLMCINAVNRLKRLKLTNCINITGAGLEPLRGSTIIEQIDLSLVGEHQNPNIYPEPPISCKLVLPILDSIIEAEGCSLRHLQFPSVWSAWGMVDYEQILRRYNEMLRMGAGVVAAMEVKSTRAMNA